MSTPVFTSLVPGEETIKNYMDENNLLDLLPVAVCIYDADGIIRKYNDLFIQICGRRPVAGEEKEQLSGTLKFYYFDGQPLPGEKTPVAVCLSGMAKQATEVIIERPDGSLVTVSINVVSLKNKDGQVTDVIASYTDITKGALLRHSLEANDKMLRSLNTGLEEEVSQRKRDLQNSEEQYHKMIEEVEDYAILMLDQEGIIRNWNKGAQKIKGYEEKEIVGRHFRVFYLPDDQATHLPENLMARAAREGKAMHEGWRVRKDGTTFWGSIVITALHDSDNNVIGFSKVTRDLTERKIAEDKIRQYTIDLEFQNKELEQFTYAAAHDMKEPLRKVQFYNNYVLENSGADLEGKSKDYLIRSITAADRMRQLIDDLLTYSKTSSHTQSFEKVNLQKVIVDVIQSHQHTIEELGAVITYSSLPVVQGISFQLTQLFDNLISNSLKYHHPDRKPQIRIDAVKIHGGAVKDIPADAGKFYHKISVSDNGIGFESHHSAKIFGMFQRLHDRARYSGTGIGLAICKKIVQNHQGFIIADAEPGKGAIFEIYIPV